jgi:SSS family solute:Na+ symporter
MGVTTVYELLEVPFDRTARRAAAGMYLVGRMLASGARLYLAAIAVSMIIFLDVTPQHIMIASAVLVVFGIVFTLFGGLNAVIWSDLVQVVLYVGGALIVFGCCWNRIPAPAAEIWEGLRHAPGGVDKMRLFDWSLDWSKPFTVWAILTGLVLLNIGNAGLDQDTSQRFLACEDAKAGNRALYLSMWMTIPVVALFMAIGSLLHIFYERPELMGASSQRDAGLFGGEDHHLHVVHPLRNPAGGARADHCGGDRGGGDQFGADLDVGGAGERFLPAVERTPRRASGPSIIMSTPDAGR